VFGPAAVSAASARDRDLRRTVPAEAAPFLPAKSEKSNFERGEPEN
jgi:hypothetical protein